MFGMTAQHKAYCQATFTKRSRDFSRKQYSPALNCVAIKVDYFPFSILVAAFIQLILHISLKRSIMITPSIY